MMDLKFHEKPKLTDNSEGHQYICQLMTLTGSILLVFILSATVQSVYLLLFALKFHRYRFPDPYPQEKSTKVSVVICSHNGHGNLKRNLPRILAQDYPSFEVIVIDDRSTDGTTELLKELSAAHAHLKFLSIYEVPEKTNPKKYALTKGIHLAENPIVVLTDSDCYPASRQWIRNLVAGYKEGTVFVLAYSMYEKGAGFLNGFIRYETVMTGINYLGLALWGNPYMGVGRNMSYRRDFFTKRGGFQGMEHITGGDDDLLTNRYATTGNTSVVLAPDASTISEPKNNWRAYFRQKLRHMSVGKYYRFRHLFILGVLSATQLLFWLCFITLVMITSSWILISSVFAVRCLSLVLTINRFNTRNGEKISWMLVPIFDLAHTLLIPTIGLKSLVTKNVAWS
jgi:cellulose synthase/poly-beta-1,6-N-acetylglucosamine synthase-like glycosyltransferase